VGSGNTSIVSGFFNHPAPNAFTSPNTSGFASGLLNSSSFTSGWFGLSGLIQSA
jgi:hypothetical protein